MLLAALFAVDSGESTATTSTDAVAWTSTDSLRSMAHHGERADSRFQNTTFRIRN